MQGAGEDGEREVDGRGDGALDDLVWFTHVDQVCVLVRDVGDGSLESDHHGASPVWDSASLA